MRITVASRVTLRQIWPIPNRDTYIFSDNHLTGAVHSGHVIPASTSPGSLSCMDLATLPIIDILRFNSLPSLYIPRSDLATCIKNPLLKGNTKAHRLRCLCSLPFLRGQRSLSVLIIYSSEIIFTLLLPSTGKLLHICGKSLHMLGSDHGGVCHTLRRKLHKLSHTIRIFQQ
ncbi:hypothetical protein QF049_002396 [Paenibacillus sp. W4I10]|nr:hypothetical protein [Paenibacillus sp. W4I10]